jgi:hypothetical protein
MFDPKDFHARTPYDVDYVTEVARLFILPGDTVEVRAIGYKGSTVGYFTDPVTLARAVASVDGKAEAVWIIPNPVHSDCRARANNQLKHYQKRGGFTKDKEILVRRWLTLDFDPVRPTGISATDEELAASLEQGERCAEWLELNGWPSPLRAMSGNGGHWLYRLPDLPNDDKSSKLIADIYTTLQERFTTKTVDFDVTLKNAARCIKLYGTMARKGDHSPELGRIHRRSHLLLNEVEKCKL